MQRGEAGRERQECDGAVRGWGLVDDDGAVRGSGLVDNTVLVVD
jgi:hypothetical protein